MEAMDPTHHTEIEQLFRATCIRFAEEIIRPNVYEWEEQESFPRELYYQAAEAGILGAGIPEEYGGSGKDEMLPLIAAEALMRGGSGGVVAGLGSLGISLPAVLNLGSEEQKQRFIPPVVAGEKIAALGITEPGTGSDVAGIKTRAVRDGDSYILNGSKLFITSGVRADYVMVLTRTSPDSHQGLTFFVVEKGTPGFTVSKSLKKTGWRASDTAELCFEDVRVPIENRLGPEGSGFVALMQQFQGERMALAFYGHATAEVLLEDAMEYSSDRQAFGRPIGRFQVLRHKLADMATKVEVAKVYNYTIARRMAAGESLVREVSMAKNFSAKMANEVAYDAVQVLGGMGYMRETRVERLSRDARLLPIGGGTHEIMNQLIARSLPIARR